LKAKPALNTTNPNEKPDRSCILQLYQARCADSNLSRKLGRVTLFSRASQIWIEGRPLCHPCSNVEVSSRSTLAA
jgi:hypothetical protein